ncbi:MAG: hypothetical protein L3J54_04820 [Draconibacterium sp.]|nr:hypothetical protein [Draconibacterium sp.]
MKKLSILLLLASVLFVSCGPSTKLVRSWSNEEVESKTFEKLAVVALTPNASSRYLIERAIVKDLKDDNIKAIYTYEIFPLAGNTELLGNLISDKEELRKRVIKKVEENEIDALMIISIFDIEKEQRFVRNNNYAVGAAGYYGNPYMMGGMGYYGGNYMMGGMHSYYNYYAYSVGTCYTDGYYVDDFTYFLECNLYDVETEELLWSGRTKTVKMESVEEEAIYFAKIVVKEVLKEKVIVP